MVAIAYTDITTPAPAPKAAPKKPNRQPVNAVSDPVVDMTSRLLSGPLHQVYAFLWRTGFLSVDD